MNYLVFATLITFISSMEHDYISEIANKFGYPIEVHRHIQTHDGYLLTLHRIPHGKSGNTGNKRKPILLMSGFLGSAENYLALEPTKSLGFLLADFGYDVWFGSQRSISYSRYHVKYNPDYDRRYWNFSLTEMGMYDLPAFIDYMLKSTGNKKIQYVGYSQGLQLMIMMCSKLPKYAEKIQLVIGLGPAVYIYDSPHPWLGLLLPYTDAFFSSLTSRKIYELLPKPMKLFVNQACNMRGIDLICVRAIQFFVGVNDEQFNMSYAHNFATNVPEGVSVKQVIHLSQLITSGRFQEFDYGTDGNLLEYGQKIPPKFDPSKMTFPVALYSAKNDWLVSPKNVQKLAMDLPNVVDNYLVEPQSFSHFDFLAANDILPLLYNRIFKLLENYKN